MSGDEILYPSTLEDDGGYIKSQATAMISEMSALFRQIEQSFEDLPLRLNLDLTGGSDNQAGWYTQFHNDMMSLAHYWYDVGDVIAQSAAVIRAQDQANTQIVHNSSQGQ